MSSCCVWKMLLITLSLFNSWLILSACCSHCSRCQQPESWFLSTFIWYLSEWVTLLCSEEGKWSCIRNNNRSCLCVLSRAREGTEKDGEAAGLGSCVWHMCTGTRGYVEGGIRLDLLLWWFILKFLIHLSKKYCSHFAVGLANCVVIPIELSIIIANTWHSLFHIILPTTL